MAGERSASVGAGRTVAPEGRRVLVTGGAGFVGSHLAAALVADNEVRVLDDCSTGRRANVPDGATLVEGDVADPAAVADAMAGADLVFHQAATASVPRSVEAPLACHDDNATGSLTVLDRARAEDARVVLASSAAVYGEPSTVPVAEPAATAPAAPYGVSKLAAEEYARVYEARYGLETVALRYFNVYGPGDTGEASGVVGAFCDRARAGRPLTVHGDGGQTRDFVHVRDVVRANLAAARTDATGRAYNVGTGRETSIRELAALVRRLVDGSVEVVHGPPRGGDIERSCADLSRATADLGYEPSVGLEAGLGDLLG